ncbi:hypothetical protein B9N62_10065 [Campylobacter concisus]|uniref:TNase-like domain-containing protein n=1 Tax=Campylobacter concisus TaxID=199 RepID=A0A1Y5MXJ4_9BACT|nr:hypothetical protein B9N62_10065 [Campylobacter concisus]
MSIKQPLIVRLLLILTPLISLTAEQSKVIKISNGDTITVLSGKEQTKVRLYGIDAPELKQPYGKKSKQFLANLIAGKVCGKVHCGVYKGLTFEDYGIK